MSIHVSPQHRVVVVPSTEAVKNLFPQAPSLEDQGVFYSVLPHTEDMTKWLRTQGHLVPAPVRSRYKWADGTPYEVQIETVSMLTLEKRAYVLNGLGTGKTKAALWAWDYLYSNGKCGKLFVSCPKSTMKFVWGAEVFRTLKNRKVAILSGDRQKRLKLLADTSYDVYVVNHHGLSIVANDLMSRTDIDTFAIDELAVVRNASSGLFKVHRAVQAKMNRVWGMTGNPIPNGPENGWAMAQVVTPKECSKFYPYFKYWRADTMLHISQFQWLPKRDALDKVYALLAPSVRFTIDDVVELPELITRFVDVSLGTKQKAVYDAIEKDAYALLTAGEITAVNSGAVLNKLLQISTGYVYLKDGSIAELDGDERLDTCIDLIMGTDRKALVFAPFIHTLDGIVKRLEKEGIEAARVSGATPQGQRDKIFHDFQNTEKYKVLAAHPNCLAHGLTLTAADTTIWFGAIMDYDIFDQANYRFRRIGQKHKQQLLLLQATRAEKKAYANLLGKQKMSNTLLDMFEEGTTANAASR